MNIKKRTGGEKPKEKAYPLKNSIYLLKIIGRAAPSKIIFQVLSYILNQVYYDVIYCIYFLKRTLEIITQGGTFAEFAQVIAFVAICKILNELVFYWFRINRNELLNIKVFREINMMLFNKTMTMDLACFENTEFYDKYKRARDVAQKNVFREFAGNFAFIVSGTISIVALMSYIISIDPRITVVAVCAVMHFVFKRVTGKLEYKKDKEMTQYEREKEYIKRTVFLKDYAKEIKTGGIFGVLEKRFTQAVENNIRIIRKYGKKAALIENAIELFSGIIPTVGGYLYACWRFVVKGDLAVADFAVLITAINRFKGVLQWVGETLTEIYKNCLYVQNLREYMEYEPKIKGGELIPGEFESLEFRNVSFGYDGSEKLALENVCFKINRGERVAVVGQNGAGKTTLTKLIMRLYDPISGEILLNGINIREYKLDEYRRMFASVFQDHRLLSLTVAENVLMREPESEEDKRIVAESLEMSGVLEKVSTLPHGADTLLTKEFDEEGSVLSGGESQKIAIARLLAKNFEIALLDEPSSALDPIAESKMYEKLIEATRGRTVIYISHRLSCAVISERILVFDGGCLCEEGSHAQLMRACGKYAEMFSIQAESYREEVTA